MLLTIVAKAQVGIGATMPNSTLDIPATNAAAPVNTDGILIPKIDAFPTTNPTALQNSMLVYLNMVSAGKQPGFYYWDNATISWKEFGMGNGAVFIANGTTIGNTMYWNGTSWVNNSGFLFNNGTSIGVNTALPSSTLTVKKDGIGFTQIDGIGTAQIGFSTDATKAVLQTHTDTDLEFATNDGGTQMILNKTTGNLGIGIFSSLEKLEANGKTKTTNLQVTNGAGLGKILTSDSSGNANWKSANSFSWLLAGNSGINPIYNFVGTTDDKDVVFKRYNILSGLISERNTAFGAEALQSNTGTGNSAFGKWALRANVAGNNNCGFGWATFYYMEQGDQNTVFGGDAANTDGLSSSTGIGFRVLQLNAGNENTVIGNNALGLVYFSSKNVLIGKDVYSDSFFDVGGAPYDSNTVAVGYNALHYNRLYTTTNTFNNTVLGSYALNTNETGNNNTALGSKAMILNNAETNNIVIGANATIPVLGNNDQLSIANVFYGAGVNTLNSSYFSFAALPSNKYKLYSYSYQLTATGDGQFGLFAYRDRDTRNDGTTYGKSDTNGAVGGYNYFGDSYSFGVVGHSNNQFNRSGGILGSNTSGTYWSALGYNNSAGTTYGIYATTVLTTGTGRLAQSHSQSYIGGGFYGGLLGSWNKGEIIGELTSGNLISNYNSGDQYTQGKQIEIVDTNNTKTATYSATSTENIVYSKGKVKLYNGVARVNFSTDYTRLLNDAPEITMTAMGTCNGIYIESIDKDGFVIKELNNGSTDVAVSWIAVGDRIDASKISAVVLEQNFDANCNEMMFNENNLSESAKAIWSENNTLRFGILPNSLKTEIQKE